MSALKIKDLNISYNTDKDVQQIVRNINLSLNKGEVIGIVGESGCGKSTIAKALTGLIGTNAVVNGNMILDNQSYDLADYSVFSGIRGIKIGHIFQDPSSSLNPRLRVVDHFKMILAKSKDNKSYYNKANKLLEFMNFKDTKKVLQSYPFQLSGGICQRVAIALALSLEPQCLIADEITSSLDTKSADEVISLLTSIKQEYGMGILFISHDIKSIYKIADRIMVIEGGEAREISKNSIDNCLLNKKNYDNPVVDTTRNVLEIQNLCKSYRNYQVLKDINIVQKQGESIGIYGCSGCGKSTLAKIITGIEKYDGGDISIDGQSLIKRIKEKGRRIYQDIQLVFQDERGCLNPRKEVIDLVEEPVVNLYPEKNRSKKAKEILEMVGLSQEVFHRKPTQLGTGQCQRVAIARALVVNPKLLILDEMVSALDTKTKIEILLLLKRLQKSNSISMLVISHEMEVLEFLCNRILVMENGKVMESEREKEDKRELYGRQINQE